MTTFNVNPFSRYDYIQTGVPAFDTNPINPYACWLNIATGEEFVCHNNTPDENEWLGATGTIIGKRVLPLVDGFFTEEFTGADGTDPDTNIWTKGDALGKSKILSNAWNVNSAEAVDTTVGLYPFWDFGTGDFDVQMDVIHNNATNVSSSLHYAGFSFRNSSGSWSMNFGHGWTATTKQAWSSGTYASFANFNLALTTYKIRMKKVGGTLTLYIWQDGAWKWNGSTAGRVAGVNMESENIACSIYYKQESNATWDISFDNLIINSAATMRWDANPYNQ